MEQNGPLPKDGTKRSPAKRWNKTVPCQKMEQNGPLPKDGTKRSPAKSWNKTVSCQKLEQNGLLPKVGNGLLSDRNTVSCQIGTRSPARSIHGLLPKVGNGLLPDRNKTVSCQKLEQNGLLPKVGTNGLLPKVGTKMVSCQKSEQNGLLPKVGKTISCQNFWTKRSCQLILSIAIQRNALSFFNGARIHGLFVARCFFTSY